MTSSAGTPSRVPAVTRAWSVLSDVAANGPASLSELSRRAAVPKSTLLSICQALVDQRLLTTQDGRYSLGLAVAELSAAYLRQPAQMTRIGLCVQNLRNPFFVAENQAVHEAARTSGVLVDVCDAEQNLQRQIDQIDALIADRVEAILLDAVASQGVEPAVTRARTAGIPVVALNVGAEGADALVTTDNVAAGALVGRYLAEALGGSGRVAIVDGTFVTATADRVAGFVSALRDYPDVEIVVRERGDNSYEGGLAAAQRILSESGPVDGFFGINDPTSLGVLEALAGAGSRAVVVSVDGAARAVEAVRRGDALIATAAQDPGRMARVALDAAAELVGGRVPRTRTRLLAPRLVTKDVADYRPWDAP